MALVHKPLETNIRCKFCDSQAVLRINEKKVSIYCQSCKRRIKFSKAERELRHKEVLEIYRLSLAGVITLFGGIAIHNLTSGTIIAWDTLIAYLVISIYVAVIVFESMFSEIRRDIEVIEGANRG